MARAKSDNKPIQRARLTLKKKYQLIKEHEEKVTIEQLKKKYKCSTSFVYGILANKKNIVDQYLSTQNVNMKTKVRSSKFEAINELAYNWLTQALSTEPNNVSFIYFLLLFLSFSLLVFSQFLFFFSLLLNNLKFTVCSLCPNIEFNVFKKIYSQ